MENAVNVDDLASLVTLDEPQLLEAIKDRFKADKIYTYIGDILIAVNPYKAIAQYDLEDQKRYRNLGQRDQEPPHIYALADSVYHSLRHTGQRQCCVVSGESGAGKTESTKYIVQQIAQLCNHDSSDLHERIVTVNPLLEAFGNAQTVINNNSSRFGKYIQLDFDEDGGITGAHISEYLLEKSRVVYQALGEKNYHIFYYMFAGLPDEILKANRLEKPDEHKIMRPVDRSHVFGTPEIKAEYKKMWDELQALFKVTGFKDGEEQGILATLAAILHLTDIEFIANEQSTDDSVIIKNEESLMLASELLMVKSEDLATALISNISVLQHSGDKLISMKNVSQANDGRDALAKALYGRMFAWTVKQVNFLLKADTQGRIQVSNKTIGILDLAGFENFQNNSFEQLCINVTNEKLHHFFNQHIFQWEMDEYRREGIEGKDIKFMDNTALLDMFMKPRVGFFAILEDQLRIPSPSDTKLLDEITRSFKDNNSFQRPKGQSLKFVINHYAGQVIYNIDNFLEKNRDTLSSNLLDAMKNSDSNFVCQMFYTAIDDRGSMIISRKRSEAVPRRDRTSVLLSQPSKKVATHGGSRISRAANNMVRAMPQATIGRKAGGDKTGNTMGFHFMKSLEHLMKKLESAEPHFIRCIKPNTDKLSEVFQEALVLQQLRYTGVLETVKIRRQGYATRLPFDLFMQRYENLCYSVRAQTIPMKEKCRHILVKLGMSDYEIGNTKVFLRYWHAEQLQLHMDRVIAQVKKCQDSVRIFLARRRLKKMLAEVKREAEEVRLFCEEVARISDLMHTMQLDHIEEDKKRHAEKLAAESKRKADQETMIRLAQEAEERERQNTIEREQQAAAAAATAAATAAAAQPAAVDPAVVPSNNRPAGFIAPATSFIWDELEDSLERFQSLSNQIWAKLFYMEKSGLMGKVYLRDWDVIINNTDAKYNGRVIGLKYLEFASFDSPPDEESKLIKDQIGQGLELAKDELGNILMRNLSDSPIIAKDYMNPNATCVASELIDSFGQIPKWFVKVFDINKFKYHIAQELHKPQMDITRLKMLSIIRFAFVKNCADDFATPCWVFMCNFSALELLGDDTVLVELLKMGHTAVTTERRSRIRREWAGLNLGRRLSLESCRSSVTSVSDVSASSPLTPPGGTIRFDNKPTHGPIPEMSFPAKKNDKEEDKKKPKKGWRK